jgi:hypothetical protein
MLGNGGAVFDVIFEFHPMESLPLELGECLVQVAPAGIGQNDESFFGDEADQRADEIGRVAALVKHITGQDEVEQTFG